MVKDLKLNVLYFEIRLKVIEQSRLNLDLKIKENFPKSKLKMVALLKDSPVCIMLDVDFLF